MAEKHVKGSPHSDEDELLLQYSQTRDIKIRNELINRYLYIAEIIAKRFVNRGVEYDDLFQVASLALIKALERYDISKGYKFSSFATPTVIGEIKNYFRDRSRLIRLPRKDSEQIKKMEMAKNQLSHQLGRSPKAEEIAEYLNISTEQVLELMESSYATRLASLDHYIDEDGETDLLQMIGHEEKQYSLLEDRDFLEKSMRGLGELEKKIIYERFYNEKSQREIAESIGVSQMYVSRLERRILERFRRMLKAT
ncbi:MAG: sigma-70 family RNA polymerase sigma factor [Clostridia bacterium]|jgi:RNA polymerase sigma-B factor